MATHSTTLAWKIPWMEEPGRLQSVGSLRVGHDWVTSLSRIGGGNGNPLQCSCLENPRDGGAWWAAVYGVAQSRTQLKWLSSSSSSIVTKCLMNGHFQTHIEGDLPLKRIHGCVAYCIVDHCVPVMIKLSLPWPWQTSLNTASWSFILWLGLESFSIQPSPDSH